MPRIGFATLVVWLTTPLLSLAVDLPLSECARIASRSIVTVRVRDPNQKPSSDQNESEEFPSDATADPEDRVETVCSGIVIGEKLVVTAEFLGLDGSIRLTAPGGQRVSARLRVIDEFSGLALLEADEAIFDQARIATGRPIVGQEILAVAGWGAEEPSISRGMVSASERTMRGAFPPLVECDARVRETSSGSGIFDRQGQLVGVVIDIDEPGPRTAMYAVPAFHAKRLLAAFVKAAPDSVIVLRRHRPTVGVTLEAENERVLVSHVTEDSAAFQAGIQAGDRVIAADGRIVRSVYDAIRPTLYKQPGDTLRLTLERDGETRERVVTLSGMIELKSDALELLDELARLRQKEFARREEATPTTDEDSGLEGIRDGASRREAIPHRDDELIESYRNMVGILQRQVEKLHEQIANDAEVIRALSDRIDRLSEAKNASDSRD